MFVFINSYLPPPAPNEEKKAGNAKIKKIGGFFRRNYFGGFFAPVNCENGGNGLLLNKYFKIL